MEDQDLIRFVDVGALGGLPANFAVNADQLWPVLFEPNPAEAEKIRNSMAKFPRCSVIERALGSIDQTRDFTVTRNPTCCSVFAPNFDYLKHYGISYHFAVERRDKVHISRYDSLFREGIVPLPDALKIDVQGFEYEVLLGFGGLLSNVLAIKLEAHFYPIYTGQKLLGEIVELLSAFDFKLRKIDQNKMDHFAGDLVEVDAYFTKSRREIKKATRQIKDKYEFLASIWQIPDYDFDLP